MGRKLLTIRICKIDIYAELCCVSFPPTRNLQRAHTKNLPTVAFSTLKKI